MTWHLQSQSSRWLRWLKDDWLSLHITVKRQILFSLPFTTAPPLPSLPILFQASPPPVSPIQAAPLDSARGCGERCSSFNGVRGSRARPPTNFWGIVSPGNAFDGSNSGLLSSAEEVQISNVGTIGRPAVANITRLLANAWDFKPPAWEREMELEYVSVTPNAWDLIGPSALCTVALRLHAAFLFRRSYQDSVDSLNTNADLTRV